MAKTIIEERPVEILGLSKSAKILLTLYYNNLDTRKNYGSILARRVNMTFAHSVKLIKRLEQLELVTLVKEGRIKKIHLTSKGRSIARKLARVKELVK